MRGAAACTAPHDTPVPPHDMPMLFFLLRSVPNRDLPLGTKAISPWLLREEKPSPCFLLTKSLFPCSEHYFLMGFHRKIYFISAFWNIKWIKTHSPFTNVPAFSIHLISPFASKWFISSMHSFTKTVIPSCFMVCFSFIFNLLLYICSLQGGVLKPQMWLLLLLALWMGLCPGQGLANPPAKQEPLGLGQSGLSFRDLFANSTLRCIPHSRRISISGLTLDMKRSDMKIMLSALRPSSSSTFREIPGES